MFGGSEPVTRSRVFSGRPMSSAVPVASISPPHDGSEFRINTTTANSQGSPVTKTLSDGGYIVVWTTNATNGAGPSALWAQRYGADGQPAGAEFKVSGSGGNSYWEPLGSALANGGFAVAWTYGVSTSSVVEVQQFDATGNRVGGAFQASAPVTSQYGFAPHPNLLALANSSLAVTWSVIVGNFDYDVHARVFSAAGSPMTAELAVNSTTAYFQAVASRRDKRRLHRDLG